jgi:hypothetical protein
MMSTTDVPAPPTLFARARGILLNPTIEWRSIRAETTTVPRLFTGYACILMAIPAIAVSVQLTFFGHTGLPAAIVVMVLSYALSLLGLVIQGGIFNILSPSFGGERNFVQAMKLAIYPQTAACVAGVLTIFPLTGIVVIAAGIYGLYILWLGLPRLMKVPQDKAVGYVILSLLLALAVNVMLVMLLAVATRAVVVGMAAT